MDVRDVQYPSAAESGVVDSQDDTARGLIEKSFQVETIETSSATIDSDGVKSKGRPVVMKRRVKRREVIAPTGICAFIVRHQIGLATDLLLLLCLVHMWFPPMRRHTRKFIELSYHDSSSGRYTRGWDDFYLVTCWVVIFTGVRAAIMDYILIPLAESGGVHKRKDKTRFAEQAWLLIYYTAFWTLGMHLWHNSRYWQDFTELWKGFPDREMDGLFKWYYLVQFAFWLQQILVVNIEERRKDYYQMFTHHILTCALIFSSYAFYCTKVGNVILCIMDIVDITLPVAKILKYLGYHLACDIAFGFFMVTWVAARHVMYLIVCWSLYKDMSVYIPYGCYQANTGERLSPSSASKGGFTNLMQSFNDPEGQVCFSRRIKWMFLSMLLLLQVLTLMWFGMIVRVAWRVINGGAAEDSRSDGEEDEGEHHDHCADEHVLDGQVYEVDEVITVAPPLEEEVGVEAINLKGRNSPTRRFRKSGGSAASGVSLPGHHSDRKELLGRIGCDKGA